MKNKEDRIKEALDLLNRCKMHHVEESYGPDCQVYKRYDDVVSIHIAKRAIETALGQKIN